MPDRTLPCPHCRRLLGNAVDLAQHLRAKHPEAVAETRVVAAGIVKRFGPAQEVAPQ